VLNPLRTGRFAEEELQRIKTDAIDALGIARFAAQKRSPAAQLPDSATEELHEFGTAARAALGGLCQPPQAVTSSGRTLLSRVHPARANARERARHDDSVWLPNRRIVPRDLRKEACTDHLRWLAHNVGEKLARALIEAAGRIVGRLASPSLGEVLNPLGIGFLGR
jgi:transposase